MKRETVKMMASWALALALSLSTARNPQAQDAKNPYPSMAPIEKYLMDRDAEIALARSAAPSSISRDATVVILGKNGKAGTCPNPAVQNACSRPRSN